MLSKMSDRSEVLFVLSLAFLILAPSRAWLARRIRSERTRRVVAIATIALPLAFVAAWLWSIATDSAA